MRKNQGPAPNPDRLPNRLPQGSARGTLAAELPTPGWSAPCSPRPPSGPDPRRLPFHNAATTELSTRRCGARRSAREAAAGLRHLPLPVPPLPPRGGPAHPRRGRGRGSRRRPLPPAVQEVRTEGMPRPYPEGLGSRLTGSPSSAQHVDKCFPKQGGLHVLTAFWNSGKSIDESPKSCRVSDSVPTTQGNILLFGLV